MNILVLMGSPRLNGNTFELLKPFIAEIEKSGSEVEYIALAEKNILPCKGCYACQNVTGSFGCPQHDDMYEIVDKIIEADCFVLATPIYIGYCTAQMKVMLDRLFGMDKAYGKGEGSLWAGKKCAIIATHGYEADDAIHPFENSLKKFFKDVCLDYLGLFSARDITDIISFQIPEVMQGTRDFARQLLNAINNGVSKC